VGFVRFGSVGGSCFRGGWGSKGGGCLVVMVAVIVDKSAIALDKSAIASVRRSAAWKKRFRDARQGVQSMDPCGGRWESRVG